MDSKDNLKNSTAPQLYDLNSPSNASNTESLITHRTRYVLPACSFKKHNGRVLEISEKAICSDILNLTMEYLYSTHVSHFSESTKFTAVSQLTNFFEFVESLEEVYINDSALVYPNYKIHLSKTTKEKSAYKLYMAIGRVLRWAKNQDALGETPKYWTEVTKNMLSRIVEIPFIPNESRQTISKAIKFDEVDDDVLFISLRNYAAYFLDKSFQLREFIKAEEPKLFSAVSEHVLSRGVLDNGLNSSLSSCLQKEKSNELEGNSNSKNLFELKDLLISALKKAPETLVGFFPSILMVDSGQRNSFLKRVINENLLPSRSEQAAIIKAGNANYPLVNLLYPSIEEQIAMCYLLSGDRIQPSGIDKLKIDNFRVTSKSVQICDFNKDRAGKGFDTPLYKSNSPMYKAYSRWFNMLSWLNDSSLLLREGNCMPLTTTQLNHKLKMFNGVSLDWYASLLINGLPRDIALIECPEVKHIVQAMDGKIGELTGSGRRVPNKMSFLCVAQSRAILELEPIKGLGTELSENILSGLSAHSVETNKNTYKDRTESNNIVRSGRMFSSDIADKMEEMASLAKSLLNRTAIVTLDEIENAIGFVGSTKEISKNVDYILEQADAMGYEIGLSGDISFDKKTYVICTPLIAGLIQGEIQHIKNHLFALENQSPYRYNIHYTRLLYLELVLEQFDSSVINHGKKLLEQYDFPFPPLS